MLSNAIQILNYSLDIPLTVRPGTSPGKSKQEPPPSYTTLQRSPCTHRDKGTLNKNMCDAYKQQVSEPFPP